MGPRPALGPAHLWPAVLVLIAGVHALTLLRYPPPFVDEAWFGNRSWALITTGSPVGTLDHGVVDRTPEGRHFFPLLPVVFVSLPLLIVGEPSLWALRVPSVLAGAALCWSTWALVSTFFTRSTACLAVALLAMSPSFFYSAHLARPDILAAAVGYAGVALVARAAQSRHIAKAGFGGFLCGVATEFHPFALVITISALTLGLDISRVAVMRTRFTAGVLAGVLAGLAVYPLLHIAPSPSTYWHLNAVIYGPTHTPSLAGVIASLPTLVELVSWGFYSAPLVLVVATVVLWLSGRTAHRAIVGMTIATTLSMALLVRNKHPYYAILMTPALAVLVASALSVATAGARSRHARWASRLALAFFVVVGTIPTARVVAVDGSAAFRDTTSRLATSLPGGSSVIGSQTYWLALSDRQYYSWEQLIYLQRLCHGMTLSDVLGEMVTEYLVRDDHFDRFVTDHERDAGYGRHLRLPRVEFETWVSAHMTLVDEFEAPVYGRVRVYQRRSPSRRGRAFC